MKPRTLLASLRPQAPLLMALATWLIALQMAGAQSSLTDALGAILKVGPKGEGHAEAQAGVKVLLAQDLNSLPQILQSMDRANPLAMNWLRSAVESIAQREQARNVALPIASLGAFLLDVSHSPQARAYVYQLLSKADPVGVPRLLPGMLNDPSMEIRNAAIRGALDQAAAELAAGRKGTATLLFQQALNNARDVDQIDLAVGKLKGLGVKTDLQKLFGWIQQWKVVGPFDNARREGYERVYPPETSVRLEAEYVTQGGKARWVDLVGADDYGKIDVNLPLGKLKDSIAYCYTEVQVEDAVNAEIRLGCKNAWKVWLNGRLLFGRDEYHRGAEIDQYRLPAALKKGRNTILVKLGQNEQKEDWTVEWEFQMRITDAQGSPIAPLRVGVPPPITASR
ncbi:MAG: hypothetical protein HY299_16860 [Verrucomicrobia bacterium]|nr:hypothetical protein [Verrucomicrobiota bacterium]